MYTEPPHQTCTYGHFSRANNTAHHPHISSAGTPHWLKVKWVARHSQCFTSISFRDVVDIGSLSSVPTCFVLALCTVIKTSASTTSIARSWCNGPSAPARWSESCRVADSVPNTEYHRSLPKTCRDCINLVQKSCQEYFSAMHCMRRNLERRHYGRRHWGIGKMDASEIHAGRLNEKHQTIWRRPGSENIRTSTLIRDHPDRGEEQGNLVAESDGSSPTPFQDSSLYDGQARNDFWIFSGNYIYRHHVEPRVLRIPNFVTEYVKRFEHGHWSFLGLGSEKKCYGTPMYKPNGNWDRVAEGALERGDLKSKIV